VSVPPENQQPSVQDFEQLSARLEQLTHELAALKAGLAALQSGQRPEAEEEVVRAEILEPVAGARPQEPPPHFETTENLQPEQKTPEPLPAKGKQAIENLETLIGGRWLTWIGAATMLVAVAFFIPWAWQYFQTPEWFKVLALHAGSLGILFFGLWVCRRNFFRLGHAVVGIGLFAWYGTALAALRTFDVYAQLFGDGKYVFTAFECALITVVAIVLAVQRRSATIILLGALGGYLNPILTSSGAGNYVVLFVYLAFLNVGLIASAVLRGWNFLKLIALCATAVMFLAWIERATTIPAWPLEWLAVLHAVVFFLGVTLPPIVWRQKSRTTDLMTLVGTSTGYMALTWYLFQASAEAWLGLVAGGLALLHAVLFALTRQRVTDQDRLPRVHLALAIFFLTLIAPLQLENLAYLPVAWALEGVVLMGIGLYYRDRQFLVSAVIVFFLAAYRFALLSEVKSLQLLLVSLLMLLGGSLAWWLPRRMPKAEREGFRRVPPNSWESITGGIALGLGNIFLLITIAHYYSQSAEQIFFGCWSGRMVLLLWTLDLLVVWMLGLLFDRRAVRIYAALAVWLPVSVCALVVDNSHQNPFTPVINFRFGSLAFLAAVAFAIATGYRHYFFPAGCEELFLRKTERVMRYVLGVYGCLVLFAALNMDIANYFDVYWSQWWKAELATYSIVWILFAVAIVVWGFISRSLFYRVLGLLAFAPILLKVFLVDLSQLDQLTRVLATFALGIALLSISFLYQRIAVRVLE
jgi:uncharacterized membrane protein